MDIDPQLDPQSAWIAIQAGVAQISGLVVSYSFSVIGALILLVGGWLIAGVIERTLFAGLSQVRGFDTTVARFLSSVARYAMLVLVIVMVLGQFGVQTASIIAAIGAVGLAIGLALQGTLQNIAAGLMLLFLRPFRIGESIKVGVIEGDVEEIGLFATRLRAADGTYILAPIAKLWNEPVYNTSRNRARRNDIVVGVKHDSDVGLAQKLMIELASADSRVRKNPAPHAFVATLGEAGVTVTLRYWTSDKDFLRTKIDLVGSVKKRFDEKGLSFSAPQPA
jgi:small conductance mechanosensitive channel